MPTSSEELESAAMRITHCIETLRGDAPAFLYHQRLTELGVSYPAMTASGLIRFFGVLLNRRGEDALREQTAAYNDDAGWLTEDDNRLRALNNISDTNLFMRRQAARDAWRDVWLPRWPHGYEGNERLMNAALSQAEDILGLRLQYQLLRETGNAEDLIEWNAEHAGAVAVFLSVFCADYAGQRFSIESLYADIRGAWRSRLYRLYDTSRRDWTWCEACGGPFQRGDMVSYAGNPVCHGCDDSGDFTSCGHCGCVVHGDNTVEAPNGDPYCQDCTSEYIRDCDECGEVSWTDEACPSCGAWPHGSISDHDGNFGDLYVQSYSYKPSPEFHGVTDEGVRRIASGDSDDPIFLGVELELNVLSGGNYREGGNAIAVSDIYNNGFLYAKSDCTVSGPEMVSHPATLAAHAELWKTFPWDELRNEHKWSGWRGANAGIHVHISRKAFKSAAHIARFQYYFGEWRTELERFAGRNCSSYGRHGDAMRGMANAITYATGRGWPDRGSAVNYQNRNTIEVRMFRSSLLPTTLAAYLEFLHGLVNYSRVMKSQEIVYGNASDFGTFYEWLKDGERAEKYSNAINRIDGRVYETESN